MPPQSWNKALLAKYSSGFDETLVMSSAESLEKEALLSGRGTPEGAFRWLFLNSAAIQERVNILNPGGVEHRCAFGFLNEQFYTQAVGSAMDTSRVRGFYEEYLPYLQTHAGNSLEEQLAWLAENMLKITNDNIRDHDDWPARNRAIGLLQKQLSFQKVTGKQTPIKWADDPPGP